ncbi:MAG: efflux RND transporter periplasmic adaptor subunit [Alphaproteobacteria bacterium]|jgi:RND family efflux transporter MFP subunit|nr:efflux RND transporter periplasmic adaptor subunit [Alphaproteobacteria bacterium]MDP6239194.1 efflux RND transporter periplasmic adaptor subunit [Alphaproteobacteria bacterium]
MRFWIGNRAHGALVSAIILTVATTATAQNTAPVGVDTVLAEPLSQTVPVAGRFVARQAGAVAARTEGAITEMTVQIGDHVTAGDVLAVFDVDRLSWRRDLARATAREMEGRLAAANSELSKKKAELTRLEGIRSSAAFNQARYDNAIQDVAIAEGTVAAAAAVLARERAALKLAEDDLRHGRLKAPYNGVVSRRHTEAGAYVRVGDPVVSLVNQDDLEIEADVPYNRIPGLAPDTMVSVNLADGSEHQAIVRALGAEENPLTRTRLVRFTPVPNGGEIANAVGESLAVWLPLGAPRQVVSVHKDAVLKRQGLSLVYVVTVENIAQIRPVELGEAVGPRFVVLDGLAPGEQVVVRGNERLRPGQEVMILPPEEPETAAEAGGDS